MAHDGNPIFQQKRVDLMLGVDMALLAGKNRIGKMALLSGDSDKHWNGTAQVGRGTFAEFSHMCQV